MYKSCFRLDDVTLNSPQPVQESNNSVEEKKEPPKQEKVIEKQEKYDVS